MEKIKQEQEVKITRKNNRSVYELYLLGFDKDQNVTDYEHLVGTFSTSAAGKLSAQLKVKQLEEKTAIPKDLPEDVVSVEVRLEKVKQIDDETFENQETIYSAIVNIR